MKTKFLLLLALLLPISASAEILQYSPATGGGGPGAGVSSVNGLNGSVGITSTGNTVTITEDGNNVNLEAAGGGAPAGTYGQFQYHSLVDDIFAADTATTDGMGNWTATSLQVGSIGDGTATTIWDIPNGIFYDGSGTIPLMNINGAGLVRMLAGFEVGALNYPNASVMAGYVLTDDGAGNLTLQPGLSAPGSTGQLLYSNGSGGILADTSTVDGSGNANFTSVTTNSIVGSGGGLITTTQGGYGLSLELSTANDSFNTYWRAYSSGTVAGFQAPAGHVYFDDFGFHGNGSNLTNVPIDIGTAVGGSTITQVLYVDGANELAQSANFTFDGTTVTSTFAGNGSALSGVAHAGDNVSEFTNDANYTTVGSNVSQFNNDAGYVTGFAIGAPVSGSNVSQVLYVDASNNLSQGARLSFDGYTFSAAGLTYPTDDSANGYVMTTNGSGVLGFTDPSTLGTNYWTLSGSTITNNNMGTVDVTADFIAGTDITANGVFYSGSSGGVDGELHLKSSAAAAEIILTVPPAAGFEPYTFILPPNDGASGYLLQTDGGTAISGAASTTWVDPSTLFTNYWTDDGSGNIYNNNTGKVQIPNGYVIFGTNAGAQSVLELRDTSSVSLLFTTPPLLTHPYTFVLPVDEGTNHYIMTTDGGTGTAGTAKTTWVDPSTLPGVGVYLKDASNNIYSYNADAPGAGTNNYFSGLGTGSTANTGNYNIFSGYHTGADNTSGNGNTFYGATTGISNDAGSYNFFAGYGVATSNTSGSGNIVIGNQIDVVGGGTVDNQLNIGNLIFATAMDGTGTTLSTGNVGIKNNSPVYDLDVAGTINATQYNMIGGGTAYITSDADGGINLVDQGGFIMNWNAWDLSGLSLGNAPLTGVNEIIQYGNTFSLFNDGSGLLSNNAINWNSTGDFTAHSLVSSGLTYPTADGANDYVMTTDGTGHITFQQVDLTAAVTGVLPAANGGAIPITTNDVTGQTATNSSVVTATSPNDGSAHQYQVGAYVNITAISAGTETMTYTFVDENSNSRTLTLFPMGLTSAALSATGFNSFPTATIRVAPNTAITCVSTFTGVSVNYDAGGSIQQMN